MRDWKEGGEEQTKLEIVTSYPPWPYRDAQKESNKCHGQTRWKTGACPVSFFLDFQNQTKNKLVK